MAYQYRSLAPTLHETAEAAIDWFIRKWGLRKNQVGVETAFDPEINFRPTFVVPTKDHHTLCIEVSENIYNNTLDSTVLHCRNKGLPVKLLVAVPKDIADPQYGAKLKAAKRAGVGIFEVDSTSGTIVQQPLSLSLSGVRPIELTDFPNRYRQSLQHAHQTFLDGEPSKACSLVYDELESAWRRFAARCQSKQFWPNAGGMDVEKDGWAPLITNLDRYLDRSKAETASYTPALSARLVGVTTHRNDSGHKPKSQKYLKKRDQALRTRFEGAVDLLKEFLDATKSFRV